MVWPFSKKKVEEPVQNSKVQENDKVILLVGADECEKERFMEDLVQQRIGAQVLSPKSSTLSAFIWAYDQTSHDRQRVVVVNTPVLKSDEVSHMCLAFEVKEWLKERKIKSSPDIIYLHDMRGNNVPKPEELIRKLQTLVAMKGVARDESKAILTMTHIELANKSDKRETHNKNAAELKDKWIKRGSASWKTGEYTDEGKAWNVVNLVLG